MAKKKNGNATFVVGSVLGAVAGAAFALWRTPMSGKELRGKLTPGPVTAGSSTSAQPGTSFTDKVIGVVEKATAPIVGVELGKTANNSGKGAPIVSAPIVPDPDVDIVADGAVNVASETIKPTGTFETPNTNARRFGWGDPAPVASAEVQESTMVTNENIDPTVPVGKEAPTEADVEEKAASVEDHYGTDSIRAKRFSWGDPTPDVSAADVDPNATTGKNTEYAAPETEKRIVEELSKPAGTTTATTVEEVSTTTTTSVDATTTDTTAFDDVKAVTVEDMLAQSDDGPVAATHLKMHKFPKLGGLENN